VILNQIIENELSEIAFLKKLQIENAKNMPF